jgi:hypothetical protein
MGHVYWFLFVFFFTSDLFYKLAKSATHNPQQRPNGAAKSATETRGKKDKHLSLTLRCRRSTTAKSPGYQDGYQKVRCGSFKRGLGRVLKRISEQIWRGSREPRTFKEDIRNGYQEGYWEPSGRISERICKGYDILPGYHKGYPGLACLRTFKDSSGRFSQRKGGYVETLQGYQLERFSDRRVCKRVVPKPQGYQLRVLTKGYMYAKGWDVVREPPRISKRI